jgi:hypothetical protein
MEEYDPNMQATSAEGASSTLSSSGLVESAISYLPGTSITVLSPSRDAAVIAQTYITYI